MWAGRNSRMWRVAKGRESGSLGFSASPDTNTFIIKTDMRNRTLFAAVLLALSHVSLAGAETSPSISQCVTLVNQDKLAEAEPFCKQAASDSRDGILIYGDFLYRKGDASGAIQQYSVLVDGADMKQPSALEITALGHRAMAKAMTSIYGHGDIDAYLEHRPNDEDMLRLAVQYKSLSDKREDYANRLLALKPDHFEGLKVRAEARLQMGDGEGALADIRAAKRAAGAPFQSEIEYYAEDMIKAQRALSRESVERMEADRRAIYAGLEAHLHGKCGYYHVPDFEDNDGKDAYWACVKDWYNSDNEKLVRELPQSVIETAESFDESVRELEFAESLLCSKMPRKARCVDDSLFLRAQAAASGNDNPKLLVRQAELNRLNQEVAAYNARMERREKISRTAEFLQGVADALSEQNQQ